MQSLEKQSEIKTRLRSEMAQLQQQQRLHTFRRNVKLLHLDELPEVKKFSEKLTSMDKSLESDGLKHIPEPVSARNIELCFTPPFTQGQGGVLTHPISLFTGEEIEDVFKTFSFVDWATGVMSLSCVSGQNFYDLYKTIAPWQISEEFSLGYFLNNIGTMTQVLNLPAPYGYDTLVEIKVNAEAPQYYPTIIQLQPGSSSSNLFGLVGVEGYLYLYAGYQVGDNFIVSQPRSVKFLDSWKTAYSNVNPFYQKDFTATLKLRLPAGVSKISITTSVNIYTHLANRYDGSQRNERYEYALIDFRAQEFQGEKPIFREFFTDRDHEAPGPIKIKEFCVSIEPYYVIDDSGHNGF